MDLSVTLPALISWASSLSGYPAPEVAPKIEFQPHSFFVEHVCGNKECKALGWYNNDNVIYLDSRFRDQGSEFASSLIVHELVHYLQHQSGKFDADSCADSMKRESEAYRVQNRYIVEAQLAIDFVKPPPTVCRYPHETG